jgi:methylglutaconyl-CoA hydratase
MNLVEYQTINRVAYISLNRPDKRNALNPELVQALKHTFEKANTDHQAKVIVLKARGEAFSAGADLAHLQQLQTNSYDDNLADSNALKELFYTIYTSTKLVSAQVEGHAIAGGCGLASICDLIFSVPEAKFGYTEVKIGFIPALVACFLLRKLGEGRMKELLLSGELIDAKTAWDYGLINFIVDKNSIESEVKNYAEKIVTSTSAQSIALTKALLNKAYTMSLEDSLHEAVVYNANARSSNDCKRGIAAFLNKEQLRW